MNGLALLLAFAMIVAGLTPERAAWFRRDWTRFPEHVLGQQLWEGQKRVIRSLQKNRWVALKSGHKVGKTHTVGCLVPTLLSLFPNARIITSANTQKQVDRNVWGEIRKRVKGARVPLGDGLYPKQSHWQIDDMWYATGVSTDSPDSIQGAHSEEGIVVAIFDECNDIEREVWQAAMSMTSDANGYLFVIANPTKTSGPFYDACMFDDRFTVETLSCYDHPNIVQGRKVMPGVTMDLIKTFEGTPQEKPRLRGEFPDDATGGLIPMGDILASADIDPATLPEEERHAGVDVADGGDENVIVITENRQVIHVEGWHGRQMETAGRVIDAIERFAIKPENVHIDGIGVGAGVVDRCWELGYDVEKVVFGSAPYGDWSGVVTDQLVFLNRRAELYWVAKELLEQRAVSIPADQRKMHVDLAAPEPEWQSDRIVKLEPKKKVIKKLGRSPDYGDAFVMSLSRVGRLGPRVWSV